jgi:hypothetical protein
MSAYYASKLRQFLAAQHDVTFHTKCSTDGQWQYIVTCTTRRNIPGSSQLPAHVMLSNASRDQTNCAVAVATPGHLSCEAHAVSVFYRNRQKDGRRYDRTGVHQHKWRLHSVRTTAKSVHRHVTAGLVLVTNVTTTSEGRKWSPNVFRGADCLLVGCRAE